MKRSVILASTAATVVASASLAGPLLNIDASVAGYASSSISSTGASTATAGRYSYIGGFVNTFPSPSWAISWDLVGDDSAVVTNSSFITNGFRVQNFTGVSQSYDITIRFASTGPANKNWNYLAVLGGTLTSDAAATTATLTSGATTPMWAGQVNGVNYAGAELLKGANFSTASTTNFSSPNGSWTGVIAAPLTVGYRMQFNLGAKSTALFTGFWDGAVVPTPGAFALILTASGFGSKRRRRTAN